MSATPSAQAVSSQASPRADSCQPAMTTSVTSTSEKVWLASACRGGDFRRVVPVRVDEVAIEPEKVMDALRSVPGVEEVPRVRSRWIGPDRAFDVIITVLPGLTTAESHAIADRVEHLLEERFEAVDATVHVEPHE